MATTDLHPTFAYSIFIRHSGLGTMAYKVLGRRQQGTPLVLIHGLSAVGLVDWLPLAEELARSRPVLIFDNRDIGFSFTPNAKSWTVQDMADDVADLVQHVGWREVDVLGFSMGGMIAQTLVLTPALPFKIRHLVLAATSTKPPHSELLDAMPSPGGPAPRTIEDKKAAVTPFIHVGYDAKYLADPEKQKVVNTRIQQSVSTRRPQRTIMNQTKAISTYDVRKKLPSIPATLPVLLIHGKLDKSVYHSEQSYITKGIQHAQHLQTPSDDYGHMWYDYFTPEFWASSLNRFLDDQEPVRMPKQARL